MRTRRFWIVAALALLAGATAGILAWRQLRRAGLEAAAPAATEPVVVAARELPAGRVLTDEDVTTIGWPAGTAPAGYLRDPAWAVGRGVIARTAANEPILASRLASREAGGGLPIAIPAGFRAVSVEVDEVVGVAGFVLPGTRVDVLATVDPAGGRGDAGSRLILQDVEVLAAGQETETPGEPVDATVVTLLVTPPQAERLTLACTEGQIHLALRNTLDREEVPTIGVRMDELLMRPVAASPEPATPPAARPAVRREVPRRPAHTVILYNGTERTVQTFPERGEGS